MGESLPAVLAPADKAAPSGRSWSRRTVTIAFNLAGAAGAAFFLRATVRYFLATHQVIGGLFVVEQLWLVGAFLLRRPAVAVDRRPGTWLVAFAALVSLLYRPEGLHSTWGLGIGDVLQFAGAVLCIAALVALGRSFGYVAADRGLKSGGPYSVVRHPVYASYLVMQIGYVLQAVSVRNVVILVLATGVNAARALAEERVMLRTEPALYAPYARRVRWRFVPWLW
jgi:protein-S-isoprenylcysteine O-methyltransferase Ste14